MLVLEIPSQVPVPDFYALFGVHVPEIQHQVIIFKAKGPWSSNVYAVHLIFLDIRRKCYPVPWLVHTLLGLCMVTYLIFLPIAFFSDLLYKQPPVLGYVSV